MKIEFSRNHSAEQRKESKNVFKTEATVFDRSTPSKMPAATPPPTGGAFAKILEETRREKDERTSARIDSADSDTATPKSERDEKTGRAVEEKNESEEKNSQSGESDAGNRDGEQPPVLAAQIKLSQPATNPEKTAPAARAILHIADLERMIATIRTETFRQQKQVLIALKNSVLKGLQIRLTIDANGQIKAEFLALNEQIKKQLNRRKNELSEILKNRAPLFSEVEIKSRDAAEKE